MGLLNISRVCLAVFSFSAITSAFAADPPVPRGNVSVTVNPTTGYYSTSNTTLRLPDGVRATPSAGATTVTKYAGGLQQSIPTGITIDAIKKSAPLPAVVRATTQSVKTAATRCLTSARCNVGLMLAGAGLQLLFDNLDWVMGEGGQIQKLSSYPNQAGMGAPTSTFACNQDPVEQPGLCSSRGQTVYMGSNSAGSLYPQDFYCAPFHEGYALSGYAPEQRCFFGLNPPSGPSVVSDSAIASGVESNYVPEPSDWPALTPQLELNDVEITSAPTLQGEPKITTVYDADGNPHEITETNIWYDFDIRDNPSSSPLLDLKIREETKTYKNGALTGTTTTETTQPAVGGGGGAAPKIDIPTDCEFMPTVCAFLDWFKNDDIPEDPDLSALIDNRDFTESYSISGGSKQCPPDYEFTVDFIGRTYGLSFQPACDFASKMYFFVMAAAYIFAAYITVGAARNG